MSISFVTTVTRSYLPLARVLMASVATHHRDARRLVVVLDGIGDDVVEHAQVLSPADLVPDPAELRVLQSIYRPIELATALKAKLLGHALDSGEQAFFLDPDMRLFAPMTAAIDALAAGTGTLLTPHRLQPPRYDDREFYEWAFRAYGVYNTGFVGVTERSRPFLAWWDSRLRRDCLDALGDFEWVDQKMIDLAPSYFDLDLFKDPGYNVGWWNLEERPLGARDGVWYAGDSRLVLMHYSGVRPRSRRGAYPYLVHSARNRVVDDARHLAAVQELEDGYVADLFAAGYATDHDLPYGLGATPGGHRWSDADRRGYRSLVLEAERLGVPPPAPDDIPWGPMSRTLRRAKMLSLPAALLSDVRQVFARRRTRPTRSVGPAGPTGPALPRRAAPVLASGSDHVG